MIELDLHDATPAGFGEPHGPAGPTHAGRALVDYEYQAEERAMEIFEDRPEIVRIVAPSINREWARP